MSSSHLIKFFSAFTKFPVEVMDVRDQIVEEYGVTDRIFLTPVAVDPHKLLGLYYQYMVRLQPYSTQRHSVVLYNSNVGLDWQRLICVKEMIHLLDSTKTRTRTQVIGLGKRLVSGKMPSVLGHADMAAMEDRIALYKALAVLFPEETREEIFASGDFDTDKLAERMSIPHDFMHIIMSSDWAEIWQMLADWD